MSEPAWVPLGGGGVDYKGPWAAGAQYQSGDVVRYGGIDYLAVNPSLGVTPPMAGVAGGPRILFADPSLILVSNTAVETDLLNYTIPAGTLLVPSRLHFYLAGDHIYNSGSITLNWRLYVAGVLAMHATFATSTISANRKPWEMFLNLVPLGALNAVLPTWTLEGIQSDSATSPVGTGQFDLRNDFLWQGGKMGTAAGDPLTADFAGPVNIRHTVQWGSANANVAWRKRYAHAELIL